MSRIVVKIGSSLLTNEGRSLEVGAMEEWAAQIAARVNAGHQVALVSSGSVVEGMRRLGWRERPQTVHDLQAAAAVGQMGLVQAWERGFHRHGLRTAQLLFTHDDFAHRGRYLNARSALRTLLDLRVVPIVNENDSVATDEIRFGDNDTLAGLVANLMEADELHILTDRDALYTADPARDADAKPVRRASAEDPLLDEMAGPQGAWGRGGMSTKVAAARLAARSGTVTIIASGYEPRVLTRLAAGEALGTRLEPSAVPLAARKRWLAGQIQLSGRLTIDDGAVRVLRDSGRSLLPVGVIEVRGDFGRGEIVACLDGRGHEVARGLVNYGADEARSIMGQPSSAIAHLLGYANEPELIHRDNLVLSASG